MNFPKEKLIEISKSLYTHLKEQTAINPKHDYLITENWTLSYEEALKTVQGIASTFIKLGMKKGDLVALRTTRSADVALITTALGAIGAVAVMTDAHFDIKTYIVNSGVDIHPDWWLTNEKAKGGISASGNWELIREGKASMPFELFGHEITLEKVEAASASVDPEDAWLILFTSGSTGKSKAVVLSHRALITDPVEIKDMFIEGPSDVAVQLLPLNHSFGFCVITCATYCGHGVVFPPVTDVDVVLKYIEKYHISCIYCVPTFFLGLISEGKHKNYDISSLRFGVMAGGPFTEQQLRFIEGELGMELMPGYGLSEYVSISTMAYGDPVKLRAAGVGRPCEMTEVTILDENGNELPVGVAGEICVRGKSMMTCYYNNEEDTRAVYDKNGKLHTGDLGYFDEDGILHISGRIKDLIVRAGENLSSGQIEKALLSVKGVYQAAVVAVKNETYGEVPGAVVILEKGCSLSVEEIKAQLKNLLSSHEIPESILIRESFPLTSSGKTDKNKIKELFN